MFERLQKKWKVGALQLGLILCTFAIGGSVTGYVGRKLMNFLAIEQGWLWVIIYIFLITLLWPIAVLVVSIPFGQFRFFIAYLMKIGRRMGVVRRQSAVQQSAVGSRQSGVQSSESVLPTQNSELITHIAVFASGAGSNAKKIIEYFNQSSSVKIALVVCNKQGAGVIQIATDNNIPVLLIEKEKFFRGNAYLDELKKHSIDFIVLAGFLWKLPVNLINAYPDRIINIHPALLPNYGGKGMYGNKVHEAVIAAGDKETGISIHYVDDEYDHGTTIFQARCPVYETDTADSLAQRIHQLEHKHYPVVIGEVVGKLTG
jgi:formyltetrahydrofolate-dependent phosphoribosylglycinamide formyltransferase